MGNRVWKDPGIAPTELTSAGMDGRFGWNLFEGRQVEIDYDNNLLIIHSRLPGNLKGYVRSKIEFIHSFICAKASFVIGNKRYAGDFLFDTGSDQAIILDSARAGRQGFAKDLPLIRTSVLRDPRGVKYESRTVLSPLLEINGLALRDIPTMVLGGVNPTRFEINFLGNDLLKRFNTILDLKTDRLYLKPNKWMGSKYRGISRIPLLLQYNAA